VTLHDLEPLYSDLLFSETPSGTVTSIQASRACVSVRCNYLNRLATVQVFIGINSCFIYRKHDAEPLPNEADCIPIFDIATTRGCTVLERTKSEKIGAGIGPILYSPDITDDPWLPGQIPIKGDTVILRGLVKPFLDDVPALVTTPQISGDHLGVVVIGCKDEICIRRQNPPFG